MKNLDYTQKSVADEAEDFHYVDKKKEVLGCLGMIGEEALGCLFQIVIGGGIILLLAAIFGAFK